jgi:uncharacterized protein YecE (DUF72 family)
MAARLFAGTSGFSYPEWRGNFYPKDLPQEEMLKYYSRIFPTVELNNTFYRFPQPAQVTQWRKATPRGFRFSVKVHRLITHNRRLRNAEEAVSLQLERLTDLGDRAGPLLFQLPPSLKADLPLLRDFLYLLPPGRRTVEFRHPSWYEDAVFALLEEQHTALTIMESDEDEPVVQFIGPFGYLRLHRSSYPPAALRAWAARIEEQLARKRDVYAYFTHEEGAPAPDYARRLPTLLEGG